MDAVLISPMEISLRQSPRTFRENNVKDDISNLTDGPMNQLFVRRYRENLGIACLAAYLRQYHISVELLNANIQRLSVEQMVARVMALQPSVVGISVLYDLHAYQTALLIRDLRRAGYEGHITLGGPFASFAYHYFLAAFHQRLDSVVRGEGEKPLLALIKAVQAGEPWRRLPGIVSLEPSGDIEVGPTTEVESLDNLPFPARDALEALELAGIKPRVASVYSSRGCHGQCTYCHAPATVKLVVADKWRYRPANNILDEIEYLVERFGIEYLYFNDDNFMGYGPAAKERLIELAQGIIDRGIKVHFHGECRVDSRSFLDPSFLQVMKDAGFKDVLLGLESGAQSTLNRWRKGTTVERNLAATRLLTEMGFDVEPAMILVDADTTLGEFTATVDFIETAELHRKGFPMYLFNQLVVFPGAPIEHQLLANGTIEAVDPWDIRHDLEDDDGLYEYIRRMSSRPYTIKSRQVAVMWDALVRHTDRLTFLVDDVIPGTLRALRSSSAAGPTSTLDRRSYLRFVSELRQWRRHLGDLALDLLKASVRLAGELDPDALDTPLRYHQTFSDLIRQYEMKYFGCSLEERLQPLQHVTTPLAMNPSLASPLAAALPA
jgi:anaerobic magnesium-protoporphyrin IX monomethyl ester cyclase